MKHPPIVLSLAVVLLAATCAASSTADKITAAEAKNQVGKTATVCGRIWRLNKHRRRNEHMGMVTRVVARYC